MSVAVTKFLDTLSNIDNYEVFNASMTDANLNFELTCLIQSNQLYRDTSSIIGNEASQATVL